MAEGPKMGRWKRGGTHVPVPAINISIHSDSTLIPNTPDGKPRSKAVIRDAVKNLTDGCSGTFCSGHSLIDIINDMMESNGAEGGTLGNQWARNLHHGDAGQRVRLIASPHGRLCSRY